MKYVLATANPGKIAEMREILSELRIDTFTRTDLGIDLDVEETGSTFFENAKIKAEAICSATGMPAIADDSGICVDALGGDPGVYSSSYGGAELSANERCAFLLHKMENVKQRNAIFVSVIVCMFPDGYQLTAAGECTGTIAEEAKGTRGFGYDPVFIPDGKDKTMAELTAGEKNALSHRKKALTEFSKLLKEYKEGMCI